MGPRPAGRIRIVHDQSETLDSFGKIFDAQGGLTLELYTYIFLEFPAVGKCAASHLKGSRAGRVWA